MVDLSQTGSIGGLSLKAQEVALRARPDAVIATPGRLIDHLRNSPTFALDALDILVLDEADRMLSDGFADELGEIIKACPLSRQTMLFSATMTDSVDELVKMSLNKPVRLFVDPKRSVARGLVQEFVRVRAGREADRSALLLALCTRSFKSGVIIFLRSKKLAHQLRIVFGLIGLSCQELHGDLTQEQVGDSPYLLPMCSSFCYEAAPSSSTFSRWTGQLSHGYGSSISRVGYQGHRDSHQLRHARPTRTVSASCRENSTCGEKRKVCPGLP